MGACSQTPPAPQPPGAPPPLPSGATGVSSLQGSECIGGEGAHLQNELIPGDASSFRQPNLGAGVGWCPPH